MSAVDTSAEAVERLTAWCADLAEWLRAGGTDEKAEQYDSLSATLRALAAERDAAAADARVAGDAARHFEADRDRLATENARMKDLLMRADEELRLIRLKDTGALYDIGLRAALSAALTGDTP